MAAKEKACMNCKAIHMDDKCPACAHNQSTQDFKGRVFVFNAEKSEIAHKIGVTGEGEYAIKTK
ncbi:MAG: hypothetical protein ACI83O_000052 [Patescibacteria group bacterium]|jgi:DNA-directed RNA polymerase subunit E"